MDWERGGYLNALKVVQEDHAVINFKHCWTSTLLSYFSMHLGYIESQKSASNLNFLLTAHNKYSRCNVHNFTQQVHYLKIKDFLHAILKWCNLEDFEKKDEYPSLIISEIMDCERGGYLNV